MTCQTSTTRRAFLGHGLSLAGAAFVFQPLA